MKKKPVLYKLIFYVLVFLSAGPCCTGQITTPLLFTRITEDNGLSDNNVNCVLKDSRGFVWIGTNDGLNQADGSTIKIFKVIKDDTTSLASNDIRALAEGQNGDIWIGTANGLSCHKKTEDGFHNYGLLPGRYGGASNIVNSLIVEKEIIWVATDGGLIRLRINTGQQELLVPGEQEPLQLRRASNQVLDEIKDKDDVLWLCTMEGLWSYRYNARLFKKEISALNDPLYDAANMALADAGDKLWVGTWGSGLKLLDKKKGTVKTFGGDGNPITTISTATAPGGGPLLWLNGDLRTFNTASETFAQHPDAIKDPNIYVNKVYISNDQWLWLCTNAGLFITDPGRPAFQNKVFQKNITSQGIVLANNEGQLLIGGGNIFILKSYNDSLKEIRDYHDQVFKNSAVNKNADALDLLIENPQSWWLATSEGLAHLNTQTGNTRWFVHKAGDSSTLPRNFISYIFIDKENKLWVFPWREGVWQMDTVTGKCTRLIDGIENIAGIKKKFVIADAAEDDAGNLWLADLDEGIILYNRITGKFSKPFIEKIGGAPQTTRIYKINNFFYSVANNVIIKWKDSKHCASISFPPEMDKKVYDFAPDKQGNWWFATQNGLIYFNEEKNIFKRFTMADGLYSSSLSANLFCTPNGKMIIGAPDFISTFTPSALIAPSSAIHRPLLTGFFANGNKINEADGKIIDLSYDENNILINWALPDYINPFKNNYYCRLQGIDSGWRYAGDKGEVQYANLSPGNYTVLLKATNANGDAALENLELHITLHPPFWKTTWFITGCLLFAGGIIYYAVSRRIKVIKTKAAIEKQMSELEMKALRAQMNPHFIFNSLNSIQECIVMNNTASAYEYLGKFSKMVRRILENSGKLFVPLKEEMELLTWYVQLEQLRFKEPVEFIMEADDNIDTANITLPAIIIQPYVENALWHGLAAKAGHKKLSVRFRQNEDYIECIIEDNGVGRNAGFKKNVGKKSMGMMITRERLLLFNRQTRVETEDLFNNDGSSAGTRIVVYLPVE